ncbi:MAG: hemolysin III family protein [Ilumatobacteraceae bacterium]
MTVPDGGTSGSGPTPGVGDGAGALPDRPALRGWLHAGALPVMVALGIALVTVPEVSAGGRLLLAVYAVGTSAMLGASAAYHRLRWSPAARRIAQRVDRSAIFLAIAGGYTPVAWVCLDGAWRVAVLSTVWGGAAVGIAFHWIPRTPPVAKGASFIVVGWTAAMVLPQLADALGPLGFTLILLGGIAYTLGALCFATRRPNPWPRVVGFHEVFHAFTLVAAGLQFAGIAITVVPLL